MEGLSARSFADALDSLNEGKASRTVSQKIQSAYGIEDLRSQMDVLAGLVVNANELLAATKEDPLTANYPPVLQSLVDSVNTVTLFSAWTPIAQALGNQSVRLALDGAVGILLMRSGQDETSAPALSEFLDNVRDRTQTSSTRSATHPISTTTCAISLSITSVMSSSQSPRRALVVWTG